jgi:hypothetical protein
MALLEYKRYRYFLQVLTSNVVATESTKSDQQKSSADRGVLKEAGWAAGLESAEALRP